MCGPGIICIGPPIGGRIPGPERDPDECDSQFRLPLIKIPHINLVIFIDKQSYLVLQASCHEEGDPSWGS